MKIEVAEFWTNDLEQMQDFYARRLGLAVVERSPRRLELQVGRSHLVIQEKDSAQAGHYHIAWDVPENQFPAALAWLKERTQPAANTDGQTLFNFPAWNADSVYFADPDGNILELIARHNQPNAATADFSANSLLAVSEFGIASQDVLDTVHNLCSLLHVELYDGAGSDTFSAVGDEEGLLIVVKRGRIWLPGTGKPADYVPFCIQVKTAAGKAFQINGPVFPLVLHQTA